MWYLYGIALLAGIANAIEPGQNATLAKATGQHLLAGLLCFVTALLCFLAGLAFVWMRGASSKDGASSKRSFARVPWWAWPGGLFGAAIVVAQLYLAESLGAAPFLGLVVTGGVVASILLDHFGLVGFERHPAGRWRIAGGLLMVVGVTLVALF